MAAVQNVLAYRGANFECASEGSETTADVCETVSRFVLGLASLLAVGELEQLPL